MKFENKLQVREEMLNLVSKENNSPECEMLRTNNLRLIGFLLKHEESYRDLSHGGSAGRYAHRISNLGRGAHMFL